MDRIPILKMGDLLLVTIQVDMHDRLAMPLQDDLTARIGEDSARGVLIDISSLDMVDSLHRAYDREHRRDGPGAGRTDGRRRHAARLSPSHWWNWASRFPECAPRSTSIAGMELIRRVAGLDASEEAERLHEAEERRGDNSAETIPIRTARCQPGSRRPWPQP